MFAFSNVTNWSGRLSKNIGRFLTSSRKSGHDNYYRDTLFLESNMSRKNWYYLTTFFRMEFLSSTIIWVQKARCYYPGTAPPFHFVFFKWLQNLSNPRIWPHLDCAAYPDLTPCRQNDSRPSAVAAAGTIPVRSRLAFAGYQRRCCGHIWIQ